MINIAVCDDEKCMSEKIEKMAEDFFSRKNTNISVMEYSSGEELLKSNERIDILFLDIGMRGMDGIETAKILRAHGYKGFLIFRTVLKEMVFQSFEVQPFDYLVKPVQGGDFEKTMEKLTADISFPVSANHPALDTLLGNKLGTAEENQIEVRCSLVVPYPCGINDIDFCIILENALDNAVSACNRVGSGKQKYIHVAGKVQGDFLLMEIENSYSGRRRLHSGTGLANIRAAVEKYQGAMEIRTEGEKFVLSILIIIPQQSGSISQQAG